MFTKADHTETLAGISSNTDTIEAARGVLAVLAAARSTMLHLANGHLPFQSLVRVHHALDRTGEDTSLILTLLEHQASVSGLRGSSPAAGASWRPKAPPAEAARGEQPAETTIPAARRPGTRRAAADRAAAERAAEERAAAEREHVAELQRVSSLARLAEEERDAEVGRAAAEAEEDARRLALAEQAEVAGFAAEARRAEEARFAEAARLADAARQAERERSVTSARAAEATRAADDARVAEIRRLAEDAREAEELRADSSPPPTPEASGADAVSVAEALGAMSSLETPRDDGEPTQEELRIAGPDAPDGTDGPANDGFPSLLDDPVPVAPLTAAPVEAAAAAVVGAVVSAAASVATTTGAWSPGAYDAGDPRPSEPPQGLGSFGVAAVSIAPPQARPEARVAFSSWDDSASSAGTAADSAILGDGIESRDHLSGGVRTDSPRVAPVARGREDVVIQLDATAADDVDRAAAGGAPGGFRVTLEAPPRRDTRPAPVVPSAYAGPRITDDEEPAAASPALNTAPVSPSASAEETARIDVILAEARGLTETGNFRSAIESYTDALDILDRADAHIGRGRCYLELGDYSSAMSDFQRAEDLDPNKPESHVAMGDLYYARREYRRAIEFYDQAVELDGSHAMARCRRGISHYHKRNFRQAFHDLQRAYQLDPEIPNIRKYVQMAVRKMEQ